MTTPVRASDHDLRALAAIVSQDRPDLPGGEGLPPSLLAGLMGQIRCDALSLDGWDTGRQTVWFSQEIPSGDAAIGYEAMDQVFWENYWDCQHYSYPARTGDLRSVVNCSDFYSARQWHSTAMYTDLARPLGLEHSLLACLPSALPRTAGPGRYVGLALCRGPGPDFSERDRAVLTLLAPHLDQAYLDAERRRHPVPPLTPRQSTCCAWWPPGTPTPRSPGGWVSPRGPCAPTWKTSTNGWASRAAPPPSPAPSPTGSRRRSPRGQGPFPARPDARARRLKDHRRADGAARRRDGAHPGPGHRGHHGRRAQAEGRNRLGGQRLHPVVRRHPRRGRDRQRRRPPYTSQLAALLPPGLPPRALTAARGSVGGAA